MTYRHLLVGENRFLEIAHSREFIPEVKNGLSRLDCYAILAEIESTGTSGGLECHFFWSSSGNTNGMQDLGIRYCSV